MKSCLNDDTLLSLGRALDWDLEESLHHIRNCPRCRESLADLQELDLLVVRREVVGPDLKARLLTALAAEMAAEVVAIVPRTRVTADRWIRFGAAATTAFVTLAVAAAIQSASPVALWPALFLALLSGVAAVAMGENRDGFRASARAKT